jgi:hypothetical protein
MWKLALPLILTALTAPALAQTAVPDLRGTWKGESQTIAIGSAPHHPEDQAGEPRLTSVPFTMVIDKQEGRRFSGTFSSPRHTEKVIAVISQSGPIYLADDDGYTIVTMLAPNRMEMCYMHSSTGARVASCTEMVKQ